MGYFHLKLIPLAWVNKNKYNKLLSHFDDLLAMVFL